MNRSRNNRDEPGVAEVRRWRAKLWKQGGGTLKGVMDLLRNRQAERTSAKRPASRQRKSA